MGREEKSVVARDLRASCNAAILCGRVCFVRDVYNIYIILAGVWKSRHQRVCRLAFWWRMELQWWSRWEESEFVRGKCSLHRLCSVIIRRRHYEALFARLAGSVCERGWSHGANRRPYYNHISQRVGRWVSYIRPNINNSSLGYF